MRPLLTWRVKSLRFFNGLRQTLVYLPNHTSTTQQAGFHIINDLFCIGFPEVFNGLVGQRLIGTKQTKPDSPGWIIREPPRAFGEIRILFLPLFIIRRKPGSTPQLFRIHFPRPATNDNRRGCFGPYHQLCCIQWLSLSKVCTVLGIRVYRQFSHTAVHVIQTKRIRFFGPNG